MKTFGLYTGLVCIVFLVIACQKDEESPCEEQVVISNDDYDNAPDDTLTIKKLAINGDCLIIDFSASGCSGKSWMYALIDAGEIMESQPPQRRLRLSLQNGELCEALISKEVAYDLRALQVEGHQVILNLANSGSQILYEY